MLSVQKLTISKENILDCLTKRQRDFLVFAKNQGYYQFPRKNNAGKIAEILNLSKSTLIEHLRKAENRLINQILQGL